ncbi:molybdopterin-dependent oxidoreductase [Nocardia sp. NBC_00508]|uniref:molybdopterin-dependent oxidoreductase n=1 Tax=Nocardia sp. NBC_00508 TaxID=2975992 RepID=UPI002E81C4FE|nr:molybdopterin-dependent oxidoreductase [Nocardia sp. NBC_00508]WUD67939.1 molybdopterin-dependent oxidoreductase [Nocardia sp. NBC_00508]
MTVRKPGRIGVSSARGPEVASRVGLALGTAITICFVTGLLSHWIQHPPGWFWWPASPVWLYRVTQGAHVIVGVAAIPLLLVKLWAVYPKLFQRPVIGSPLRILERGSIALLVGATIFELSTGLFNIAQYYPWKFFFPTAHYAMAYIMAGALVVHLAVKLPVIRAALSRPLDEAEPADRRHVSRRAVVRATWLAAGVAVVAVAGQTVPFLRWASLLAPRSGVGPQGVPVNRSAAAAGISTAALDPGYRLTVSTGGRSRQFTRAELLALPQTSARLPIACVEGWSASAEWSGVRLRDLLAAVGSYRGGDVRLRSLETGGIYYSSVLPQRHAIDANTLIALAINGETLELDHGYPCRLIAPNRPGVLQTKWLSTIEVLS